MDLWSVVCRPVTDGAVHGLCVLLVSGNDECEVGRVAFVRQQATKAPDQDVSFQDKLRGVLDRADVAADLINDTLGELDRLQQLADAERAERERQHVDALAKQLREAIGSTSRPSEFQ